MLPCDFILPEVKVCMHVYLELPFFFKYSVSLLSFHQNIYWTWHTVSTFAFCLCTLVGAAVEQAGWSTNSWQYIKYDCISVFWTDCSVSLPSHTELPQHGPPEPHVLSWCRPAQCSHYQYLPHRPQLHAESLRGTWAALQQPGHWAGRGPAGHGPRADSRRTERTGPATTAASAADETHQCTW